MALPTDVRAISDPFAEPARPEPDPMARVGVRAAPMPWRVGRILIAFTMVLTGVVLVAGTFAVFWWPGLIIVAGVALIVGGAFFVRVEPSVPEPPPR